MNTSTLFRHTLLPLSAVFLCCNSITYAAEPATQPADSKNQKSIARAQEYYSQEQYGDALVTIEEVLADSPCSAEALVCKGNILGAMCDKTEDMMQGAKYGMGAMMAFDQAVRCDPDNVSARIGRGVSNLMAPEPFGNIDAAITDFHKAVELDPKNVEACYFLGVAYHKKGKLDKAESAFRKVLHLAPDHEQAKTELKKLKAQANNTTQPAALKPARPFALVNVTVVDVKNGKLLPGMTVVVSRERISQVAPTKTTSIPQGIETIDAAGKYLIPGLWDMHTHIVGDPRWFFPLFLANGVTGIRDMHSPISLEEMSRIKEKLARSEMLGPRLVAAGQMVDGSNSYWPGAIGAGNESEAKQTVARLHQQGADFIKVYSFLSRDAYFAIAAEAKKRSIPFVGHVPLLVSAFEASNAGQRSIEHLDGILTAASSQHEQIKSLMLKGNIDALTSSPAHNETLDHYDETRAQALFALFAKNETWQVPTLTVFQGLLRRGDPSARIDPRLKYIPDTITEFFGWQLNNKGEADVGHRNHVQRYLDKSIEITGKMHQTGVPIMAGTDSPYVNCFPGFSLHEELVLLNKAGLSPAEVLRCATLKPAEFLGVTKSMGTIAEGKVADMVLLEANPLEDIRNTSRIAAVISRGQLLEKKQLNDMLAEVETMLAQQKATTASKP